MCRRCRGQWERIGEVVGGPTGDTMAAGSKWHDGQVRGVGQGRAGQGSTTALSSGGRCIMQQSPARSCARLLGVLLPMLLQVHRALSFPPPPLRCKNLAFLRCILPARGLTGPASRPPPPAALGLCV